MTRLLRVTDAENACDAPSAPLRRWRLLVIVAFCAYALLFIYRTSFVIDGTRYFSLLDDEMISMRYAKNLVHGDGLVWNPGGSRVEGYTNLGWVLWMALAHLVPISAAKISVLIQLSGLVFLLLNLLVIDRIALLYAHQDQTAATFAMAMTAFYYPLANWSLQGTEVGALTLLTSCALLRALRSLAKERASMGPYLILGIGSVIRIDFLVPLAALLVFSVFTDRSHRARHLAAGGSVLAVSLAAQSVFRILYYGDILPNTYYLKMTGAPLLVRLAHGLWVTLEFAIDMNWALFLVPFVAVLLRRDRATMLLMWMVAVQIAYSAYVGGDAWEAWGGSNRFVTPIMPLFFVVFCSAVTDVASRLHRSWPQEWTLRARVLTSRPAVGLFLIVSILSFNSMKGPKGVVRAALVVRPLHVEDNRRLVRMALAIRQVTSPDARVAVVWAGAVPYFSGRYAIDLLGKNDPVVAHEPMRLAAGYEAVKSYLPGHNKWDLAYSIGVLEPDLIAQTWWSLPPQHARSYERIRAGRFTMLARRASPRIQWMKVQRASHHS